MRKTFFLITVFSLLCYCGMRAENADVLWSASGTFTESTYPGDAEIDGSDTWNASIEALSDGSYRIPSWKGNEGYDFTFALDANGKLVITNYTEEFSSMGQPAYKVAYAEGETMAFNPNYSSFEGDDNEGFFKVLNITSGARYLKFAWKGSEEPSDFDPETLITSIPKGEKRLYFTTTDCYSHYASVNYYVHAEQAMAHGEVTWCPDNEVYFKDISKGISWNTAKSSPKSIIRGEVVDGNIIVKLPQAAFVDEKGTKYYLTVMRYNPDSEIAENEIDLPNMFINIDEDRYSVRYTVDANGNLALSLDEFEEKYGGEILLGYNTTYAPGAKWDGNGDNNQTLVVNNEALSTIPADVTMEKWILKATGSSESMISQNIELGTDANKIYIKGLCTQVPDAVITGTIDGNVATFEANQYMGYFEDWDLDIFLLACTPASDGSLKDEANIKLYLNDDNTIWEPQGSWVIGTNTCNNGRHLPLKYYYYPKFEKADPNIGIVSPMDPDFSWYEPNSGQIQWYIYPTDVAENPLDPNDMWYNIYVDGEKVTLSPDDYENLTEALTDIPFTLRVANCVVHIKDAIHNYYVINPDVTTLGVQSHYKASDGKVYSSRILTYNVKTKKTYYEEGDSGIENITTETPIMIFYTNLMGIRVDNPDKGVYIKTTVYSNGTKVSSKVAF